jgi:hypothetical protein
VHLSFFAWLKKTFAAASARISCKLTAIDILRPRDAAIHSGHIAFQA